jgi:hypothetical protein
MLVKRGRVPDDRPGWVYAVTRPLYPSHRSLVKVGRTLGCPLTRAKEVLDIICLDYWHRELASEAWAAYCGDCRMGEQLTHVLLRDHLASKTARVSGGYRSSSGRFVRRFSGLRGFASELYRTDLQTALAAINRRPELLQSLLR